MINPMVIIPLFYLIMVAIATLAIVVAILHSLVRKQDRVLRALIEVTLELISRKEEDK